MFSSKINDLLPAIAQNALDKCNYLVFYNITCDEYNLHPTKDNCECIVIGYDFYLPRLVIVDGLKIDLH